MKKFIVIYKAPLEEFQKAMAMSPEEQQKFGQEWGLWMEKHKSSHLDGGPVGKTKEVSTSGITDIKNDIGSYAVVQAETHEEAAQIFADSPHLTRMNGTIEVMEVLQM